jgi:hypothetical protein
MDKRCGIKREAALKLRKGDVIQFNRSVSFNQGTFLKGTQFLVEYNNPDHEMAIHRDIRLGRIPGGLPWFSFSWEREHPTQFTTDEGETIEVPWYTVFSVVTLAGE